LRGVEIAPTNLFVLYSYATFLQNKRKDFRKADLYYVRAFDSPNFNAHDYLMLKTYSIFLRDVIKVCKFVSYALQADVLWTGRKQSKTVFRNVSNEEI
jgi:hypothetical protein